MTKKSFKERLEENHPPTGNYKRLLEMPMLIPPESFGYDGSNENVLEELLNNVTSVLQQTPEYALYITGTTDNGYAFVHNKKDNTLDYCLNYVKTTEFFGTGVTVAVVWNNSNSPYTKGVTDYIIFRFLLRIHKRLISDSAFTEQGKTWWVNLMKKAATKMRMYSIYIFSKEHETVEKYNWDEPIDIWIKDNASAWGPETEMTDFRFIITEGSL